MAGSTLGKLFTCTTWGDTNGSSIGVVVDGVPAGLMISENDIQQYLNRRKTGAVLFSSRKHESDFVTINSGVLDGVTTGMPVSLTIMNSAAKDTTFTCDREVSARAAAGAIAVSVLKNLGVEFCSYVKSIGDTEIDYEKCSVEMLTKSPLNMPDGDATASAMQYLSEVSKNRQTAESTVEVVVMGLPAGVGSAVFDRIDAEIVKAVTSIGHIRNVEFDKGFTAGFSDGSEAVIKATFTAPESTMREIVLAPGMSVVVESMVAITLLDGLLVNMGSSMDKLTAFYAK